MQKDQLAQPRHREAQRAVAISWYDMQILVAVPGDRRVAALLAMTAVVGSWFFCFAFLCIQHCQDDRKSRPYAEALPLCGRRST